VLVGFGATASAPPASRRGAGVTVRPVVPALGGAAALIVLALLPFTDLNVESLALAGLTLLLVIVRLVVSLHELGELVVERAREATIDPLTGLGNRRMLLGDLAAAVAAATAARPAMLAMFDLDGFKTYNDTFGHPAGDALLMRIAAGLAAAVGDGGRAYRIGGDEFCVLVGLPDAMSPDRLAASLAAAMGQKGDGFAVTASHGCAVAPRDGRDVPVLLRRADEEMYTRKSGRRPGAERQVQDALLAALRERDPELGAQASGVAALAEAVGRRAGLGTTDLRAVTQAAALHDIGKIAIPDGILEKPAPLDAREWAFMRNHPLIAQRIMSAAPALAYAARIVRSAQEHWDGTGYPDGLSGERIPLTARVVGICTAYQAMTADRPYERALTRGETIAELRRCAGTQFDPGLVPVLVAATADCEDELRSGEPAAA
jgi:diguanylate cyclase (GGDEF)-like protein